ncbi:MAG: oxidoreductase [Rhodobacterales bacterium]|nr:MAG: oxidoreductase [Rhodobacterales bacterium]
MARNDERLKDGLAVVTGAGGGLGRALAVELCKRGVRVAGFGRRAETLQETGAFAGDRFESVICDVSNPGEVTHAFQDLRNRLGPVTVLINNAATYPRRDFLEETPESFMATVATNLGGPVACCHAALQDMTASGFGRILNVATFADIAPLPTAGAYSVSKGAARILTRALIADLGDRFPEIVIGDWMPGMLATKMGIAEGLDPAVSARWGAELALWHDPALTGACFEQDREVLMGGGLKSKLKNLLMLRRPARPRQI